MSLAPDSPPLAKPENLLNVPVGFASPLWGLFAGAAISGAAWWWMTRWTRPQNLEAMYAASEAIETAAEPALKALEAPVVETLEDVAAAESVVEAMIEAAPEPASDRAVEAVLETIPVATPQPLQDVALEVMEAFEPVAAEPQPIAAAVADVAAEAVPGPKPRKKAGLREAS